MLGFFYTINLHILPLDIVCVSDYKVTKSTKNYYPSDRGEEKKWKNIFLLKKQLLNSQQKEEFLEENVLNIV